MPASPRALPRCSQNHALGSELPLPSSLHSLTGMHYDHRRPYIRRCLEYEFKCSGHLQRVENRPQCASKEVPLPMSAFAYSSSECPAPWGNTAAALPLARNALRGGGGSGAHGRKVSYEACSSSDNHHEITSPPSSKQLPPTYINRLRHARVSFHRGCARQG